MKKLWIALMCLASPVLADGTSMYDSPEAFLADLERMSVRCGSMADGQIDEEYHDILFARTSDGDRCTLGPGDLDPLVSEFFAENELTWAGLIDANNLWVAAQ